MHMKNDLAIYPLGRTCQYKHFLGDDAKLCKYTMTRKMAAWDDEFV